MNTERYVKTPNNMEKSFFSNNNINPSLKVLNLHTINENSNSIQSEQYKIVLDDVRFIYFSLIWSKCLYSIFSIFFY